MRNNDRDWCSDNFCCEHCYSVLDIEERTHVSNSGSDLCITCVTCVLCDSTATTAGEFKGMISVNGRRICVSCKMTIRR